MKIKSLIFGLLLGTMSFTQAQVLLSVDFGGGGVESGFNVITGGFGAGVHTGTFGSYTVSVTTPTSGGFFTADGGVINGSTPSYLLYRDFVFGNDNGDTLTFDIHGAGLTTNTVYSLRLWSFQAGNTNGGTNKTVDFADTIGTGTASVNYASTTAPTTGTDYSTILTVLSDSTVGDAHITFTASAASNGFFQALRVNGFELSAVPEPSTVMSLGLGLLLLGGLSRWRRHA